MSTPAAADSEAAGAEAGADGGAAADVDGATLAPGLEQAEKTKASAANGATVLDSERFVINVVLQFLGVSDEHRNGRTCAIQSPPMAIAWVPSAARVTLPGSRTSRSEAFQRSGDGASRV
jgi:hypothetical protein